MVLDSKTRALNQVAGSQDAAHVGHRMPDLDSGSAAEWTQDSFRNSPFSF